MSFAHLHVHDEYSTLDGYGSPDKFAARAAQMGFEYLGISNHGNIDSTIKFLQACKKNNLKSVIGCELYIDRDRTVKDSTSDRKHINLFVKDQTGWTNLLRLLTIANQEGFYKKPRIDAVSLLKHLDGLIVTTACSHGFVGAEWGENLYRKLVKLIPDDLYLELQPHDWEEQVAWNKKCLKLHNEFGTKIIATNDCHYPGADDSVLQELLLAVATNSTWDDPKRWKFSVDTLFLCSENKMRKWFKDNHPYISERIIEESFANTIELAKKCCDFRVEKKEVMLPLIAGVNNGEENDFFERLIRKGFKRKILSKDISGEQLKVYEDRVAEEFDLIKKKKFVRYFLIVWELINWCDENNILTGPGRGSSGGSLIAYLLSITNVDPLEYNLLFSRFLNPDRNDMPDIDCDFEPEAREKTINHFKKLYGRNNVIQITTFLAMKGKMALQDVGRVFEISRAEISAVTKTMDDDQEFTVESFRDSEVPELRNFYKDNAKIVDYAVRLQGTIRGYGKHAAGVCISGEDLTNGNKCNLCNRHGGAVANWDKDDCEYMGLLKLDVLGLSGLSRIHECLDLIKKNYDKIIDLKKLTFNDQKVFADINAGDCTGVFQLGTPGITRYCTELGVDNFKDIYNATALFRPGPLQSGMAKDFVERKHGKKWKAIHPKIKELTADTYGIIVYQEQIMFMAKELAGFPWAKCDKMRKVIAKSKGAEEFNKFRDDFVNGCVEQNTLDRSAADKLFDNIVTFSSYSFNLSHSVVYSMISYWDAWLKHYYPLEFFASSLSFLADKDKKKDFLRYVVDKGYTFILPRIGLSQATKWSCVKDYLVMPFSEIIGVGEVQAEEIVRQTSQKRQGFFSSSASDNLPPKIKTILNEIGAYKQDYKPGYNEVKKIKAYFEYNLISLWAL